MIAAEMNNLRNKGHFVQAEQHLASDYIIILYADRIVDLMRHFRCKM